MQIRIRPGYEDAAPDWMPDTRIMIDVFRASTTALTILESGTTETIIANDLSVLQQLAESGVVIISEVFPLGLDNSPTLVRDAQLRGRRVALKTSNLTTALDKNDFGGNTVICCFNNLSATIHALRTQRHQNIEIIPAGQMDSKKMNIEDLHCAEVLMQSLTSGKKPHHNTDLLRKRIAEKCDHQDREQHYKDDLNVAIQLDVSSLVPTVVKRQRGMFWLADRSVR